MERPPSCDEEAMDLPGFRFHPTDEELVSFYLRRRAEGRTKSFHYLIRELDIYKCDPWEIPSMAKLRDGQREWYFFCPRDKKYKNSNRPNRVTKSGFWKATGTDKQIVATNCVGLKKSLVFYTGKASKGQKTDWMMHEFRLPTADNGHEEPSWAICKIFKRKASTNHFTSSTCAIGGGTWPGMSNLDKPMPSLMIPKDHDLDHDNECDSFASEDDSKSQNSSLTPRSPFNVPFSIGQTNDHIKAGKMLIDEWKSQNNSLASTPRLDTSISIFNGNIHDHQFLDEPNLQNISLKAPNAIASTPQSNMISPLSRTDDARSRIESPRSVDNDKSTFKGKKPSKLKLNQSSNKGTIGIPSIPFTQFRSPLITPLLDEKSVNYHKTLFQSWGLGDESKAFIENYSQNVLPLPTPESIIYSLWSP